MNLSQAPKEWTFLDKDDLELKLAWEVLGDPVALDEKTGEVWEYMGTQTEGGVWRHVFRHRCHPTTERQEYIHVTASEGWVQLKGGIGG